MKGENVKKILITTTFREFEDGNKNSEMQEAFLNSLIVQTYQNFIIVVTLFGEKNVESVVREYLGDKAIFVEKRIPEGFRYSPTEVICSGIEVNHYIGADILLDCSGDIRLEDNFLESVEKKTKEGVMGASFPNIFVNDLGDMVRNLEHDPDCIDVRFFDAGILGNEEIYYKFKNYPLYDWGGIEHFITAIGVRYFDMMINIFSDSKVVKRDNDRLAANETDRYMKVGVARNHRKLKRLAMRIGINPNDIVDMKWVCSQYHSVEQYVDYSMNTSNKKNINSNNIDDRYWVLFSMMKDWCLLFQKGKRIEDYLIENDLIKIAIYGLGDVGEILYNELQNSSINIVCGIDKSEFYLIEDMDVITPNNELPVDVDAIIVTPIMAFEDICNSLKDRTEAKIISLEDIISTLLRE